MSISFNGIPSDIRTPGYFAEFDGSKALKGLPAIPHVALIVAPRLTTGTAADLTPFQITSGPAAEAGFGRGSVGSFMGQAWRNANPYTEVWGIGVADAGGGVAATGTMLAVGTATAAGTIAYYIAGVRIPVSVAVGDTPTIIGASLVAAMANYELPVTGVNASGTVTMTARNKGTTGNDIDLRVNYIDGEVFPAGVTAVTVVAMASGATDGSVSGAIAAMGDVQYHTIVSAWNTDAVLDLFEAELLDRWGPMEQKEGHLFAACKGSQGTMTTAGNLRNSLNCTLMGSGLSPTPTWVWSAVTGAVDAYQTPIDPLRPRTTLLLKGLLPPAKTSIMTRPERNILLTDGVSTFTVDSSGNCLIERLITTYQLNAAGIADVTYLDLPLVRGEAAYRYVRRARITTRYPRHKLADDGTNFGAGQAIVTPGIIKSELIALEGELVEAGWVEDLATFKASLIVERNTTDANRVDILSAPNFINQFLVVAESIQFRQ